jgi:hypothetical protein
MWKDSSLSFQVERFGLIVLQGLLPRSRMLTFQSQGSTIRKEFSCGLDKVATELLLIFIPLLLTNPNLLITHWADRPDSG